MEMELTVVKGHTPENDYDGYPPHRHWELINMPVSEYMQKIVGAGLVYPGIEFANLILNPRQIPWIKENVQLVGYDFMELVDPEHYHLYAFDNYHDGIDGQQIEGGPGTFIKRVQSGYISPITNHRATAEIFSIKFSEEEENNMPPLERWKTEAGTEAVDELSSVGIISNPDDRKKTLDQPAQLWEVYVLLNRVLKEGKK